MFKNKTKKDLQIMLKMLMFNLNLADSKETVEILTIAIGKIKKEIDNRI